MNQIEIFTNNEFYRRIYGR